MNPQASEFTVDVHIAPQFERLVDADLVRRAALAVLAHEGVTGQGELSVVITDDDEVHDLNRRFRGVDAPTDVLAFGEAGEEGRDTAFVTAPDAPIMLGDVVIACPRAQEQAVEAGHAHVVGGVHLATHFPAEQCCFFGDGHVRGTRREDAYPSPRLQKSGAGAAQDHSAGNRIPLDVEGGELCP